MRCDVGFGWFWPKDVYILHRLGQNMMMPSSKILRFLLEIALLNCFFHNVINNDRVMHVFFWAFFFG